MFSFNLLKRSFVIIALCLRICAFLSHFSIMERFSIIHYANGTDAEEQKGTTSKYIHLTTSK